MKLKDLFGREPSFRLKATGSTHNLRLLNLGDEIWLQSQYESGEREVFDSKGNLDFYEVCRVVFRLLKDKSYFEAQDVTEFDEDTGEKRKVKIGGAELLSRLVSGPEEKTALLEAFNTVMVESRPELKRAITDAIEEKKSQVSNDGKR